MKQLTAYLLAFYVFFSALTPCYLFDRCEDESVETNNHTAEKGCRNCSPFSVCTAAQGITVDEADFRIGPVVFHTRQYFSEFLASPLTGYLYIQLRPPRIA